MRELHGRGVFHPSFTGDGMNVRVRWTRLRWMAVCALVVSGACARAATSASPSTAMAVAPSATTTVYLVRHAETAAQPADDPPLTPAGEARAKELAAALADAGVQAVITTQLLRTRDTARPLAERFSIAPEVVPVGRSAREHAKAVADAVRAHAGQVVLVVGHSNTVNLIVEQLGGPRMPDICDKAYANLFTVQMSDGRPTRLVRAEYGARLAQSNADCPGMSP